MLFFLIPFPLCKYYVWGFFYDHFSFIREIARQYESPVMNTDYIIVVNRDSILLSPKVQSIYVAVLFFVSISFFILWKQITQYGKMKQICYLDAGEAAERKLQEIFFEKKAMLNIKRNVKLICSEYCESPVTIGVLSPTILFPAWDQDHRIEDELCEYMLTHELVHMKHNDVLIKLTALLVMAIHWFNPFAYLLVGELSCISEMYCDSVVMEGKGEKERSKYGIGCLYIEHDSGVTTCGTAFLVGKKLALTAAHCVDGDSYGKVTNMTLCVGQHGAGNYFAKSTAYSYYVSGLWNGGNSEDSAGDWALIKLKTSMDTTRISILPCAIRSMAGKTVMVSGYGSEGGKMDDY